MNINFSWWYNSILSWKMKALYILLKMESYDLESSNTWLVLCKRCLRETVCLFYHLKYSHLLDHHIYPSNYQFIFFQSLRLCRASDSFSSTFYSVLLLVTLSDIHYAINNSGTFVFSTIFLFPVFLSVPSFMAIGIADIAISLVVYIFWLFNNAAFKFNVSSSELHVKSLYAVGWEHGRSSGKRHEGVMGKEGDAGSICAEIMSVRSLWEHVAP